MLSQIDWILIVSHLGHLVAAYVLALPIGWDREREARGIGLRTFPLVAMASCGYVLLGLDTLEGSQAQARILYGLMTGIGFLGGGAILKQSNNVRGMATAAAIWTTGAIGAAVAWQRYEIALPLSLITFATLHFLEPLKRAASHDDSDEQ